MADYEVLAPGGHENLINNITERLDEKAYIDGYYQQLTAGAADNLTGRGDGVAASYLYRTTGGEADVADGTATVESIHGRTVVWNQVFLDFDDTWGLRNVTTSYNQSTNTVTVTSGTDESAVKRTSKPSGAGISGHKYYIASTVDTSNLNLPNASVGFNSSINLDSLFIPDGAVGRVSGIITATGNSEYVALRVPSDTPAGRYITFKDSIIIDLTRMFGAGNEPSTAAEFEALYPEPYYPYDAGSLLFVQMEGIETVGFNAYDLSTGTAALLGGNEYQITGTYTALSYSTGETITPDADGCFTPTANGTLTVTGGSSDTCVHLTWSGYRNGEYEQYWQQERGIPAATYFPSGMRGAGSAYDELTSDAAVTRINAMNLGDRTWNAYSSGAGYTYYCNVTGGAPSKASGTSNIICTDHPLGASSTTLADGEMIGGSNNTRIYIRDDSCTTEAAMKTARSGEILYYELETPTTTPIDPPLNLTYRVSDFGTERIMVPANEQSAPPTMQVVYGINAVDTIRRLPQEYISHDSFTQFRIALGAKLGVFIIETWDETDNRYEYTINDA